MHISLQRDYDLFEQFPDGSPMWRGRAAGVPAVCRQLVELSQQTQNECFAMHLPTREVAACMNVGGAHPKIEKRLVGYITYDHAWARERSDVLRAKGFEVVTIIGNEAAKLVLDLAESWKLFVVDEAPKEVKKEMKSWLKATFPNVPIRAFVLGTLLLRGTDSGFTC